MTSRWRIYLSWRRSGSFSSWTFLFQSELEVEDVKGHKQLHYLLENFLSKIENSLNLNACVLISDDFKFVKHNNNSDYFSFVFILIAWFIQKLEKWAPIGWWKSASSAETNIHKMRPEKPKFCLKLRFRFYPKKRDFIKYVFYVVVYLLNLNSK